MVLKGPLRECWYLAYWHSYGAPSLNLLVGTAVGSNLGSLDSDFAMVTSAFHFLYCTPPRLFSPEYILYSVDC